jgi:hypothetical protein
MPIAYCYNCKKNVNAMPSGSGVIGGVIGPGPGPLNLVIPIRDRYQSFYCPVCGTSLVTTEQKGRYQRDESTSEFLFWTASGFLLITTLAGILQLLAASSPDNDGLSDAFMALFGLLCLGSFATYISLLIYGKRQLKATGMAAIIISLAIPMWNLGIKQQHKFEDYEKRQKQNEEARRDEQEREEERKQREVQLTQEKNEQKKEQNEQRAQAEQVQREEEKKEDDRKRQFQTGGVLYSTVWISLTYSDGVINIPPFTKFNVISINPDGTLHVDSGDQIIDASQDKFTPDPQNTGGQ